MSTCKLKGSGLVGVTWPIVQMLSTGISTLDSIVIIIILLYRACPSHPYSNSTFHHIPAYMHYITTLHVLHRIPARVSLQPCMYFITSMHFITINPACMYFITFLHCFIVTLHTCISSHPSISDCNSIVSRLPTKDQDLGSVMMTTLKDHTIICPRGIIALIHTAS